MSKTTIKIIQYLDELIKVGEKNQFNTGAAKEALKILNALGAPNSEQGIQPLIDELKKIDEFLQSYQSPEQALTKRAQILNSMHTQFTSIARIHREIYQKINTVTKEQFIDYYETVVRIIEQLVAFERELEHDEIIVPQTWQIINNVAKIDITQVVKAYNNANGQINTLNEQHHTVIRNISSKLDEITTIEKEVGAVTQGIKDDLQRLGRKYNKHSQELENNQSETIPKILQETHDALVDITKNKFTQKFQTDIAKQIHAFEEIVEILKKDELLLKQIIQLISQHQQAQSVPDFSKSTFTPINHQENQTEDETKTKPKLPDDLEVEDVAIDKAEDESEETKKIPELDDKAQEEIARLNAEKEIDETLKQRIRLLVEKLSEDETTITNLKQKITELQSKTSDQEWINQMQKYLDQVEKSVLEMKNQNSNAKEFDHYHAYLEEKEKRAAELNKFASGGKNIAFKELINLMRFHKITDKHSLLLFEKFITKLSKYLNMGTKQYMKTILSDESKKNLRIEREKLRAELESSTYKSIYDKKYFEGYDVAKTGRILSSIRAIKSEKVGILFRNLQAYKTLNEKVNAVGEEYQKIYQEKPGETASKLLAINQKIINEEKQIKAYLEELRTLIKQKAPQ